MNLRWRPQKPAEVKVPALLADLYRDLRDRNLLPLLALIAAALVAVPILLGGGGSAAAPPLAPADGGGAEGAVATGAGLEVVVAAPGLRDYRKRLRGEPTDPFHQRYTSVPAGARLQPVEGAAGAAGGAAPPATPSSQQAPPPAPATGEAVPGDGAADGGPERSGKPPGAGASPGAATPAAEPAGGSLFGWRPVVRFGVAGSHDLATHEHLPLGSLLPAGAPVLTFVGASENGRRALFSLTREVTMVRGEAGCVGGRADCKILSMQAGQAVDLLTATRAFRLNLRRIDLVELPPPRRRGRAADSSAAVAPRWAAGVAALRSFSK